MKRLMLIFTLFFVLLGFVACKSSTNSGDSFISSIEVKGSTSEVVIVEDTINSSFTIVDEEGVNITSENNVFVITTGGTFTASGKLEEGQIYVNASGETIEIVLEGVSLSNSSKSPIFVNDCETLEIKAKKGSTNYIYDNRCTDYSDSSDETVGTAAIYAKNGDLKFTGKGTLSIVSNYNSGIHGKDNVKIKNLTLLIKAMNNGIKGNDKVTIEENPTIGIVCGNNGIVTSNSDKGSSSQHGYIYINGGTITINSYGDGIDAAYAVEIGTGNDDEGNTYTPVIDIYTNIYSSYSSTTSLKTSSDTSVISKLSLSSESIFSNARGGGFNGGGFSGGKSAEKSDSSAKAIKAVEAINISNGTIFTYTYDDGLHTNNDTLETGVKGSASINISGGTIKIKASDDGIHADGELKISEGEVYIAESHEGLEGNIINITGGTITIFADDDGVNASSQINISGGRLDVSVSPNGDTDGIDSNGTITISGGVTIARGPNSEMAAPIDADGTIKATGGTLIIIGYAKNISGNSLTKSTSTNGLTSGSHIVTIGSQTITYENNTSYSGKVTIYASSSATIK